MAAYPLQYYASPLIELLWGTYVGSLDCSYVTSERNFPILHTVYVMCFMYTPLRFIWIYFMYYVLLHVCTLDTYTTCIHYMYLH